ncbi:hypothetical protein CBR_g4756 [Chara braunii]|uniref:Uncharacterized protein n=1 Tax=Chara braunii TaxID=69332 RepID=A0A388KIQ2_CHABU|nr:hypothetical protein CBR_g4756 [Chara braunii]|eukprot:GBG69931.1 hypothetical protein CBR_g4756 [Chara braunii]
MMTKDKFAEEEGLGASEGSEETDSSEDTDPSENSKSPRERWDADEEEVGTGGEEEGKQANGEDWKSDADSEEEAEEDFLGVVGNSLSGEGNGEGEEEEDEEVRDDGNSIVSDTQKNKGNSAFKDFRIYTNESFFLDKEKPDPVLSTQGHMEAELKEVDGDKGEEGGSAKGGGLTDTGEKNLFNRYTGIYLQESSGLESPSKRAKGNDTSGIGTSMNVVEDAQNTGPPEEEFKGSKRSLLCRSLRKELSLAGPMRTITRAIKDSGPAKEFLTPLICSDTVNGIMVLTRITQNEGLKLPAILITSTPSDEEVIELTKRHVLNHMGTVARIPTIKMNKYLSVVKEKLTLIFHFVVLGLRSINDSFDKWCELRVHWIPLQDFLINNISALASLHLPEGRSGTVATEWIKHQNVQDLLKEETLARMLQAVKSGGGT